MRKLFLLTHALLTLLCVGCCAYLLWQSQVEKHEQGRTGVLGNSGIDYELRKHQEVSWLGGHYELPAGEKHWAVVVMKFEDGQLRGRHTAQIWTVTEEKDRILPFAILWGPTPVGTRVTWFCSGASSSTKDEFFVDIGGNRASSTGAPGSRDFGILEGCRVIGLALSSEACPGKKAGVMYQAENAVDTWKRVVALGVRPFASEEEAREWIGH